MSRIEEIKKRHERKSIERREALRRQFQEFSDHPLLYIALIVSGFLSAAAGLAIGLGVKVNGGNVTANFDFVHLFFAAIYAGLFPLFFEYGLANWLHKLLHREPDNKVQMFTSGFMVALTFIGTAVTAYSAMDVLVTGLGFFESFTEVSPAVQRWIAFSLPTMFMLNVAAGELFRQFSSAATLQREAEMELREKQLEADNEVRLAQMDAEKNIAIHAANEYSRRATEETPKIGQQKGSEKWKNDKARHGDSATDISGIPATVLATDTEQVKLKSDGGSKHENPTQAGR